MAHFNPQKCEPSCCVNCAGRIILDEDNCTLCWETSGDVVRAELWRMDTPPVLVDDRRAGCICDPEPGNYELRVFCQRGPSEFDFVVYEDTVPDDWDCEELCCDRNASNGCLSFLGDVVIEVTYSGYKGCLSQFNGTYVLTKPSPSSSYWTNLDAFQYFISGPPDNPTAPLCGSDDDTSTYIYLFQFFPYFASASAFGPCKAIINGPEGGVFYPVIYNGVMQKGIYFDSRIVSCTTTGFNNTPAITPAYVNGVANPLHPLIKNIIGNATISWRVL